MYTNYYRFGQTLIDKVVVMAGIRNKFTYHFDGEENLHKIVALKKGVCYSAPTSVIGKLRGICLRDLAPASILSCLMANIGK